MEISPILMGMNIEELYCFVNEHPIYMEMDLPTWKAAVERKLGQIYVRLPPSDIDDRLPEVLAFLGTQLQAAESASDQVAARSELAKTVDVAMAALAARYDGEDRHFYDVGIYLLRLSLCSRAASRFGELGERVRRRRHRAVFRKRADLYERETQAIGGRLAALVTDPSFPAELAPSFRDLAARAVATDDYAALHEDAEALVQSHGFHAVPFEGGAGSDE